jgi:peptidyl-prolyl cis-trans isomerase C
MAGGKTQWIGFAALAAVVAGAIPTAIGLSPTVATAEAQSRSDRVVAVIGDAKLTVGDLESRLARVPGFRLREMGSTPDEIRKNAVDQLVALVLLAEAARAEKLDERDDVRLKLQGTLISALQARLREEALRSAEVSEDAIRAFYESNRDKYVAVTRLRLQQIVLKTREDADKLIKQIRDDKDWDKNPTVKWEELVKKWSIDKATAMTGGDLGFVSPDGTTEQKRLKVNPALFAAASKVKDGEIVPEPVQDGSAWVILARQGSYRTPERTLATEAPTIRNLLAKQQVQSRMDKIIEGLRKQYLKEIHPERLDDVNITIAGDLTPTRRPGSLPRGQAAERPGPPRYQAGDLR